MPTVADIVAALDALAPATLAEEWDNTGLLLGDPAAGVTRAMTCLTVTPTTAEEAIGGGAGLVVAHHPLPFRAVKRIVATRQDGALIWRLASAGVALVSPHTRFDSAARGINAQLAERLGMGDAAPLVAAADDPAVGAGRVASPKTPTTTGELGRRIERTFNATPVRLVGDEDSPARRVGFACGSGGSLLEAAAEAGCDTLVTGEATFHTCLSAEAAGVSLLLMGHYASERFAVEWLAERLTQDVAGVEFWSSQHERDPLRGVR